MRNRVVVMPFRPLLWIVLLSLFIIVTPIFAQTDGRSGIWERWDVLITNIDPVANRFRVTEIYDVRFEGMYERGSRAVERRNLTSITDVRVMEAAQPLRQNCSGDPVRAGSYCVTTESDNTVIAYGFITPANNSLKQVTIEYTVVGALRVYDGGDQLWWSAVPPNHPFPIRSSTLTMELPAAPREGVDPVVTYNAPGSVQVSGRNVTARAIRQIEIDEAFSVRAQYPHQEGAAVAPWQSTFDSQRAFEANTVPLINVIGLGLAALIGLGGPLLTFTRYMTNGQAPKAPPVPDTLSEPPSQVPAAAAGRLLDGKAELRHILATLVDLARKGHVTIQANDVGNDFAFRRTGADAAGLFPFERSFLSTFFASADTRTTEQLRNSFYDRLPLLKADIDMLMEKNKLIDLKKVAMRKRWLTVGRVLLAVSLVIFAYVLFSATRTIDLPTVSPQFVGLVILAAVALLLNALALILLGGGISSMTERGAEQVAKWSAFKRYMERVKDVRDVQAAAGRFNDYLPYAIAFGLDRTWINRFKTISEVQAPTWYYPYGVPYDPYYETTRGGYVNDPSSPFSRLGSQNDTGFSGGSPGGFSLDSLSGGLGNSLDSMSTGLATMLNSAASAMTSMPTPVGNSGESGGGWSSNDSWSGGWSSGGSDFSGGGDSGGGDSSFD